MTTWTNQTDNSANWSDKDLAGPAYDGTATYDGARLYGGQTELTTWTNQTNNTTTWT